MHDLLCPLVFAQASAVDALLRKHSRSFAAGKRPDDADVDALARPFGRRRQIW